MPSQMTPAQINEVAASLLIANSFLDHCDGKRVTAQEGFNAFPIIPIAGQETAPEAGGEVRITGDYLLLNHGSSLGWAYVCFVWLWDADKSLYIRALRQPGFARRWREFLWSKVTLWNNKGPRTLRSLVRHLRNSLVRGRIEVRPRGTVDTGTHILFTSVRTAGQEAARIELTFEDFAAFSLALFRAHRAAALGESPASTGQPATLILNAGPTPAA